MKITMLQINEFIEKSKNNIILDVRSPAEFLNGHIPGAVNIPLFDDNERGTIGTLYKNSGREEAVLKGLEITGPKLQSLLSKVLELKKEKGCNDIFVHCWRGGLRSNSFAWMLELAEVNTFVLSGGYKAYRNHVLSVFDNEYKIVLLSGETGCGKTDILKELKKTGEQIIDLEGLAHHKGSVFGGVGRETQPTSQQFENNLSYELEKTDRSKWIWFENESPSIGRVYIPKDIVTQMKAAPVMQISLPKSEREKRILREYGDLDLSQMEDKISKLKKYLGSENCMTAIEGLHNGTLDKTISILLAYYDKTYNHYLKKYNNKAACCLELTEDNPENNAETVKHCANQSIFSQNSTDG